MAFQRLDVTEEARGLWEIWQGPLCFAGAYSHENVCSNPSTAGLLSALPVQSLHPIYEVNARADLPVTPQSALVRCLCKVARKGPGTAQRCLLQPRCTNCPRAQFTGYCDEAEGNTDQHLRTRAVKDIPRKLPTLLFLKILAPSPHEVSTQPSDSNGCVARHTLASET